MPGISWRLNTSFFRRVGRQANEAARFIAPIAALFALLGQLNFGGICYDQSNNPWWFERLAIDLGDANGERGGVSFGFMRRGGRPLSFDEDDGAQGTIENTHDLNGCAQILALN